MSRDTWLWIVLIGAGVVLFGKGAVSYMGRLSIGQITNLAQNAGFLGTDLVTAVSIAMAESGNGDPNALGDVGIGQGSFGLWQINSKYHPEFGPDFTTLYDPQTNANAAYQVYRAAGYSFTPWSTFKNGAYLAYVPDVQQSMTA